MAQYTMDVPDAFVPDLVEAIAAYLGQEPPATDAERIALAQAFTKAHLKQLLVQHRTGKALAAWLPTEPASAW